MKSIALLLFFSAGSHAAPDGAALFVEHCAACHGDKGDGGVGTPLALPSFLDSVDDRFLRRTIRHGRPGRIMPAFPELGDAQVDALVSHIRSWSTKPAPVFSTTPVRGDVLRGRQLYASHCARCHGENAEGGEGTGVTFSRQRKLPIIAPGLNNTGFLAAASDEMIRQALVSGRKGTPMKSMQEEGLEEKDINDLTAYIRSFESSQAADPESGHPHDEPVIVVESPYTLDETIGNLKEAVIGQNFLLIREDYLEHGLVREGEENRQEVILHFCNFKFLIDALNIDPRVGMFLPCRVTVMERDGKVQVTAINPLYLSRLFNNSELDDACREMHRIYTSLIEDATL